MVRSVFTYVPYIRLALRQTRCGYCSQSKRNIPINPHIVNADYAVRGSIVDAADVLQAKLNELVAEDVDQFGFKSVMKLNIGNPQALGQRPITFARQLLAACSFPDLWSKDVIPTDVIERAKQILRSCDGGSMGSYSNSHGVMAIREHVAEFIERRDGYPADLGSIFMLGGASEGIRMILNLIGCGDGKDRSGVMIPVPQYPLYSASLAELNLPTIPYYLEESSCWSVNSDILQSTVERAKATCRPTVLVVINPGNPTGQCLSEKNMIEIVEFCAKEQLILMADEVYQDNVYAPELKFHSFKKVARDMNLTHEDFQLVSFHSASKGFAGECGQRGGYMELIGFSDHFLQQLLKVASIRLCPPVGGQVVMDAIVKPPHQGGESYELYMKERSEILQSLEEKAQLVSEKLNQIDGIQCNPVQGAMYAFPKITIPDRAIRSAQERDSPVEPDELYCLELLEAKGVCVVPGSGFKQQPGTHHFRMTILPPIEEIRGIVGDIADFHRGFTEKYS